MAARRQPARRPVDVHHAARLYGILRIHTRDDDRCHAQGDGRSPRARWDRMGFADRGRRLQHATDPRPGCLQPSRAAHGKARPDSTEAAAAGNVDSLGFGLGALGFRLSALGCRPWYGERERQRDWEQQLGHLRTADDGRRAARRQRHAPRAGGAQHVVSRFAGVLRGRRRAARHGSDAARGAVRRRRQQRPRRLGLHQHRPRCAGLVSRADQPRRRHAVPHARRMGSVHGAQRNHPRQGRGRPVAAAAQHAPWPRAERRSEVARRGAGPGQICDRAALERAGR